MALPDTIVSDPQSTILTGVAVAVVPADARLRLELERAPEVAGAPGAFGAVATFRVGSPNGGLYIDRLPLSSTAKWWYRVRHVQDGMDPSPWIQLTAGVRAQVLEGLLADSSIPLANLDVVQDGFTYARPTFRERNNTWKAGENLLANPSGEAGDYRNWKWLAAVAAHLPTTGDVALDPIPANGGGTMTVVDDALLPAGVKAFEYAGDGRAFVSDELVPVETALRYILTMWGRESVTGGGTPRLYYMLAPYNKDGVRISPQQFYHPGNVTTTLAAPVNPGDTTITLTDASGFPDESGSGFNTYIALNVDAGGKSDIPNVNVPRYTSKTGNVLNLTAAIPAGVSAANGSSVRFHRSGANYIYCTASAVALPTASYSEYTGAVEGEMTLTEAMSGVFVTKFWPGTRYVRVGLLPNNGATGQTNRQRISRATFYQATRDRDVKDVGASKLGSGSDLSLPSVIKESGGKAVNRLLGKTLAGDPDQLDSVPDGLTYGRPLLTGLTSGQVDLAKAGVINKVAANILRTGGGATLQAIVANVTDTGHAATAMQDSTGLAVNRGLKKALSGDPNTVDSVADGTTYQRTLATALTSGQVDMAKAGVVGKVAANILRTGGGATLQAIVANITDTSHAGSSMQDSTGIAVNRGLKKSLSGDPDTIDSVGDGTTYKRTTANEKTGAGRGYNGLDTNNAIAVDIPAARKVAGGTKPVWRAHTNLIPNGEWEFWDSFPHPLGWAFNDFIPGVGGCLQEASTVFSGDYAISYQDASAGHASPTYVGAVYTYDGSSILTVPMRAGRRYRLVIASRAPATVAGRKYRVRLQLNATLNNTYLEKEFDYLTASTWQVDDWTFTVPVTAGKNCGFSIDVKGQNGDSMYIDSIRLVEDPDDYVVLTGQLLESGYNLAINGSFEEGLSFWGRSIGDTWDQSAVSIDSASPYSGTGSLKIAYVADATFNIRQVSRSADAFTVGGRDVRIAVLPGDEIIVRAVMKVNNAAVSIGVGFTEYDASGTLLQNTVPVATLQTSYTVVESSCKIDPAGSTAFITPLINVSGLAASREAYVDSIRIFRKPAVWRCRAYRSATQSIATATYTAVQMNGEVYDTFGGHDNSTNPERISMPVHGTAMPKAGLMLLVGSVQFASSAGGVERRVRIRKYDDSTAVTSTLAEVILPESSGSAITDTLQVTAFDHDPATFDYYWLEAYQDSGGNLNVNAGSHITWFSLTQLM